MVTKTALSPMYGKWSRHYYDVQKHWLGTNGQLINRNHGHVNQQNFFDENEPNRRSNATTTDNDFNACFFQMHLHDLCSFVLFSLRTSACAVAFLSHFFHVFFASRVVESKIENVKCECDCAFNALCAVSLFLGFVYVWLCLFVCLSVCARRRLIFYG